MTETKHTTDTWMPLGHFDAHHKHRGWVGGFIKESTRDRAIACWNACEGINPEAVPDLLAALMHLVGKIKMVQDPKAKPVLNGGTLRDSIAIAQAAIAKAEGSAA